MRAIHRRLAALRGARILKAGGLIAHQTSTLPGVAASPASDPALARLRRFKQRRSPFLLLADATATALRLARHLSPELRRAARSCWPGTMTLVFPGRPGLPECCYDRGMLAVRVDADAATRLLARAAGGLVVSSSLNRRGETTAKPGLAHRMRHRRWINAHLGGGQGLGRGSRMLAIRRNICTVIRP